MQKGDFVTKKQTDYVLLDSGDGEKLEMIGGIVLCRPELEAVWKKSKDISFWSSANAVYARTGKHGKWAVDSSITKDVDWIVDFYGIKFSLNLLPSKHIGVFPEHLENWLWMESFIKQHLKSRKQIKVLNLFGYTGGASLFCARAGADVVHVDAMKFAIDKTKVNMNISGLSKANIRLIVEDVKKFVEREIKRGNKYDVIIMDPPVYGRGPKHEIWNIDSDLVPFLERVKKILTNDPLCVILNGYSYGYSPITYEQVLNSVFWDLPGNFVSGNIYIQEKDSNRLLSAGIYARYEI